MIDFIANLPRYAWKYLKGQMVKDSTWYGIVIITLLMLHLYSWIFIFGILLILCDDSTFSNLFRKWTDKINAVDGDLFKD